MSVDDGRGSSRSEFLKQAAGAAAVVAGVGAGAGSLVAPAAAASSGNIRVRLMELEGKILGRLVDVSGGDPGFEVVTTDFDTAGNPNKLLGRSKWSNIVLKMGAAMSQEMYDWISESMVDATLRKDGAIITADFNNNELSRTTFTGAQLASITIPRLLNRPQAFPAITVELSVDSVSDDTPSSTPVSAAKQKAWLCSNFRFECKGLPANRVASIDSFTWKCARVAGSPPHNDPGDLTCTIAPAALPAWQQWYDNFALNGDASDERDAVLTVFSEVPQVPLFTCAFGGLGIFELPPPEFAAKQTAQMYMRRCRVSFTKV